MIAEKIQFIINHDILYTIHPPTQYSPTHRRLKFQAVSKKNFETRIFFVYKNIQMYVF